MGDPEDQIYGKVSSDMDPFKKILTKIPGFSGYMERQARRDSDKILRDTLADRFEELWQRVSTLQREFIRNNQIKYVDDLEAAAIKMRTFAVNINEEELAQLYDYDATMLDLVDEVGRAIDNIEMSVGTDGLDAAIRHLEKTTQQCIDVYNRRSEVVTGAAGA